MAEGHPTISRSDALRITAKSLANDIRDPQLTCYETKPSNCNIYNSPSEPCWYIYAPWGDGRDGLMLLSGRVILVGKQTGTVHYDGSAGDEG